MHTNWYVLIEISMEIGMIHFLIDTLVSSLLCILHWINLKYSIPKCSSFFSRDVLLTNWFFLSCILVKVSSLNLTFCRTSSLQSDEEEEPRKFHWITVKPAWFFAYFLFCLKNVINIYTGDRKLIFVCLKQ